MPKAKRSDFVAVPKKIAVAMLFVLVAAAAVAAFLGSRNENLNAEEGSLEAKFAALSSAHTSLCAGPGFIVEKSGDDRLQGACCSAMDLHRYSEQVEGLKKYAGFEIIPPDPYDIPVPVANKLLDYQKTISLTPEQQAVYDEAVRLSHEGGPCCCKCWRWYAFEGLAKYLIAEEGFTAEQIADVWDFEDGCGGKGHEQGEGHNS